MEPATTELPEPGSVKLISRSHCKPIFWHCVHSFIQLSFFQVKLFDDRLALKLWRTRAGIAHTSTPWGMLARLSTQTTSHGSSNLRGPAKSKESFRRHFPSTSMILRQLKLNRNLKKKMRHCWMHRWKRLQLNVVKFCELNPRCTASIMGKVS